MVLSELQISERSVMYGDNQGTLQLIRNQKINDLTKFVAINYHFMRNLVLDRHCFDLDYAPTSVADLFTKSLARPQFGRLRKLCMDG